MNLGKYPTCPVCRKLFKGGDYIYPSKPINNSDKYKVYLNTRNRTHAKRFNDLYEYISNLIRDINQSPTPYSHTLTERERNELKIMKLLKCIDRNNWFLQKNSWGRTTQKEDMRKSFIAVLKIKLNEWRDKGFIMANYFIYKFRDKLH
jgi:hypothetical protein